MEDPDLELPALQQTFTTVYKLTMLYSEGSDMRERGFRVLNMIRSEVTERYGYDEMLKLNLLVSPSL